MFHVWQATVYDRSLQDLCDIQRQLISLLVFFDRVKPFIHSNRKPHDADAIDDLR